MIRTIIILACLLPSTFLRADDKKPSYPTFDYRTARTHEIKPHRTSIPHQGIEMGSSQLSLTLIVSPTGDVTKADAAGEPALLKLWPELQGEVMQWKFTPFEKGGKAITAQVEEYVDLVPPERLPKTHAVAPIIRPNSKVTISLVRTACFGTCPAYKVTIDNNGIAFEGAAFVAARGHHTDRFDPDELREFAKKFVAADFYSMEPNYQAGVTDCPTYALSISIDDVERRVVDYMGTWVGMPAVITDLEDEVDSIARTSRWVRGTDGLVAALRAENFNFHTFDAQVMLKEAASRGEVATLRQLLAAGVPLKPIPAPKPQDNFTPVPFDNVGWLNAAADHPEAIQVLIAAKASQDDQADKDLALSTAVRSGSIKTAKALIAYGANPNADLSKLAVAQTGRGMRMRGPDAESILIAAAQSTNPEMIRLILSFHPQLEIRDKQGKTALFAVGGYRVADDGDSRAECVRLLARAGADINAHDAEGDTPLHTTFFTDIVEELLNLGADVNARNKKGETPIFATFNTESIAIFVAHGADLTLRNNKGQTVLEAAKEKGTTFEEAVRQAIQKSKQR